MKNIIALDMNKKMADMQAKAKISFQSILEAEREELAEEYARLSEVLEERKAEYEVLTDELEKAEEETGQSDTLPSERQHHNVGRNSDDGTGIFL